MTLADKLKISGIKPPINQGYENISYKKGIYNRDMKDYLNFTSILNEEINEKGVIPSIDIINAFQKLGMIELTGYGHEVGNTYCNKAINPYLNEFGIKSITISKATNLFAEKQIKELGIPIVAKVSCKDDKSASEANRSLYYKNEVGLFNYLQERLALKTKTVVVNYNFFYNPLNKDKKD